MPCCKEYCLPVFEICLKIFFLSRVQKVANFHIYVACKNYIISIILVFIICIPWYVMMTIHLMFWLTVVFPVDASPRFVSYLFTELFMLCCLKFVLVDWIEVLNFCMIILSRRYLYLLQILKTFINISF